MILTPTTTSTDLTVLRDAGIPAILADRTLLRPALTTVVQPTYDLGVETGRLLRSRIEGYAGAARTVTLSPELRICESSRPRQGAAAGGPNG